MHLEITRNGADGVTLSVQKLNNAAAAAVADSAAGGARGTSKMGWPAFHAASSGLGPVAAMLPSLLAGGAPAGPEGLAEAMRAYERGYTQAAAHHFSAGYHCAFEHSFGKRPWHAALTAA